MASEPGAPDLEDLLRGPVDVDAPERRWAHGGKAAVLVSVFILYHLVALLVHTTPSAGFAQPFNHALAKALGVGWYMRFTSSVQSWAMFAPNPHRTNSFLQVRVETQDGDEYDLLHDMYGRRDYPYFFYDRMGKINRRLIEQDKYQRTYAAWVCRDWAMTHGGEAPRRVLFTKLWTRVPHPRSVYSTMGFDPFQLRLSKENLPSFDCATTQHAQVPDEVRARLGLPPLPPGAFQDVQQLTWWDRVQVRAKIIERRRAADSNPAPDDDPPPGEAAAEGGGD